MFGLRRITPLSTICQLYSGGQFYKGGKTEDPGEETPLSQGTDKICLKLLYRVHIAMSRVRTHTFSGDMYLLHR